MIIILVVTTRRPSGNQVFVPVSHIETSAAGDGDQKESARDSETDRCTPFQVERTDIQILINDIAKIRALRKHANS
jgi:hypothetical protein